MDRDRVLDWLRIAAEAIHRERDSLTDLDKEIGDGDHGINMDRGFQKVLEQLGAGGAGDIAAVLKTTAMTLISTVGGASGPLYGTFFLRAASACGDRAVLQAADLAALWQAGVAGVRQRGRAQPGDKTMVDALAPAAEALEQAARRGDGLREAVAAATEAADRGVQETLAMMARKGRASYLGERSCGHQDPGATSAHLILQALVEALK